MKKIKILIVENDEDEQFFMRDGFQSSGLFEIVAMVRNGDLLFEWLAQNPDNLPGVILSDLNMPGKNGYDILETMKVSPTFQGIPVLITSTSSSRDTADKCLRMGAAAYLVKPDTFLEYVPYAQKLSDILHEKNLIKL